MGLCHDVSHRFGLRQDQLPLSLQARLLDKQANPAPHSCAHSPRRRLDHRLLLRRDVPVLQQVLGKLGLNRRHASRMQ